ncbi:FAD/NAD(P)-binding protein [Streptomyces sp. NBC_00536]|uniref:FAD/NAD(P)-binding protein n=1 Tax=Streptomyces sp. NBC_00536 TaxID=2975769 RepID=UPI002E8194C9|nr:FAD/NAD(P)-binding protein [Streptomyces sp. NBC_00536]WUC83070.1 FAD/NAD(P)-binding protein [Streptomyces sp. NBC_00536]
MNRSGTAHDIAVVGAGAAGALTALRLLHNAAVGNPVVGNAAVGPPAPVRIWLIDPETTGRGLAFGTDEPHHLLNVPAGRMSAHRDDPGHFVRWLGDRGGEHDFVPRGLFGRYLAETLEAVSNRGDVPALVRVPDRVVSIGHRPESAASPLSLRLRGGQSLDVDAAVLALGNFAPGLAWAPPALRDSETFLADPWASGALTKVPEDRDVLLVGTGLTMVDMALSLQRPGRVVHALSRHGLIPQPHATTPVLAPAAPELDTHAGLAALRRAVLRHIAHCRRVHGDWRAGVDSLRPVTSALWQQLSPADQARLLAQNLRLWETHRHRIPPSSAKALRTAVDTGLVSIGRGVVANAKTAADTPGDVVEVQLDNGRRLRVGAVLNCTGSEADLTRIDDCLVTHLLDTGLGSPAPVGGGFDTTARGRLRPAGDRAPAPLWTLGSLRRGNLLETTAIPEIRCQADDLALLLLDRSAVRTPGEAAPAHREGV